MFFFLLQPFYLKTQIAFLTIFHYNYQLLIFNETIYILHYISMLKFF